MQRLQHCPRHLVSLGSRHFTHAAPLRQRKLPRFELPYTLDAAAAALPRTPSTAEPGNAGRRRAKGKAQLPGWLRAPLRWWKEVSGQSPFSLAGGIDPAIPSLFVDVESADVDVRTETRAGRGRVRMVSSFPLAVARIGRVLILANAGGIPRAVAQLQREHVNASSPDDEDVVVSGDGSGFLEHTAPDWRTGSHPLRRIVVAGDATVKFAEADGGLFDKELTVVLTGAAELILPSDLELDSLEVSASGDTDFVAKQLTARRLSVRAVGGAFVSLPGATARELIIDARGSARIAGVSCIDSCVSVAAGDSSVEVAHLRSTLMRVETSGNAVVARTATLFK